MTTRDFPRRLYGEVIRAWYGQAYVDALAHGGSLPAPANPTARLTNPDDDTTRWEWDTDLTAQQAADFDDIVAAATRGLDRERYAAVKDDLASLRTYHGLASPTAAQTAAATKAIIRVLRVLIRD